MVGNIHLTVVLDLSVVKTRGRIGVITIFGLFIAIVVSALSGGSPLPLKLYHPLIASIAGLILLISIVIKRPLLIL